MTRILDGPDELQAAVGEELGVSSWFDLPQARIDAFADATGDRNPMHVDPAVGAASAFGTTIAHGLLTLSLGPMFTYEIVEFRGFALTLNYGYEKVRFIAPLPAGGRVRMRSELLGVQPVSSGLRATLRQTFEAAGVERPVCVAESILHFA